MDERIQKLTIYLLIVKNIFDIYTFCRLQLPNLTSLSSIYFLLLKPIILAMLELHTGQKSKVVKSLVNQVHCSVSYMVSFC